MNFQSSPAAVLTPSAPPTRPTRSPLVTALAWCMIVLSALGCIVSMASLLMVLAGSHGSASATLTGGLVVMGIPPATLIASIGLLRRWRWAYGYVLLLLGSVAAW